MFRLEHVQYLGDLLNFIGNEDKTGIEIEQAKISTSHNVKDIIYQFTETSKLAQFLPKFESIILSRSVSLEIRLLFIQSFAEVIRKAK
jgi:hypothetical protein